MQEILVIQIFKGVKLLTYVTGGTGGCDAILDLEGDITVRSEQYVNHIDHCWVIEASEGQVRNKNDSKVVERIIRKRF